MLQGHEDADAARGGIDGADEGDQQNDGVGAGSGKREPCGDHQAGSRHQQLALIRARAEKADPQRHQRRAEQRQRRHDADLQRAEADRRQIDGQQHGDEAVAEIAQGARPIDATHRVGLRCPIRLCDGRDADALPSSSELISVDFLARRISDVDVASETAGRNSMQVLPPARSDLVSDLQREH